MNRKYEINQQIRKAFYWLDMITVSGEAVEILAMARKELRAVRPCVRTRLKRLQINGKQESLCR